ncbi:MAG TPA: triose-phosphate isomerase [Polyangiaceae bacterium]|nr:triose-phosphate isomerase [Polyangiaceae bacterium]
MNPARTPLIAGNWKMFHGGGSGCALAHHVAEGSKGVKGVDIVVAPPFTALAAVSHEVQGSRVEVAAQNLHPKPEGAFTGEVSAPMLLESGCKWVIIGHSERRQFFGETDAGVHEKTVAAIAAGLRPIVCIGETLAERESGKTLEVLLRQVDAFAKDLAVKAGFGVIAYEPVWAIGTGKVAGPDQAEEAHAAIRRRLADGSPEVAEKTAVLYGGSVKPDNAASLLACPNVDGALVGGASLDAKSFLAIVRAAVR